MKIRMQSNSLTQVIYHKTGALYTESEETLSHSSLSLVLACGAFVCRRLLCPVPEATGLCLDRPGQRLCNAIEEGSLFWSTIHSNVHALLHFKQAAAVHQCHKK